MLNLMYIIINQLIYHNYLFIKYIRHFLLKYIINYDIKSIIYIVLLYLYLKEHFHNYEIHIFIKYHSNNKEYLKVKLYIIINIKIKNNLKILLNIHFNM